MCMCGHMGMCTPRGEAGRGLGCFTVHLPATWQAQPPIAVLACCRSTKSYRAHLYHSHLLTALLPAFFLLLVTRAVPVLLVALVQAGHPVGSSQPLLLQQGAGSLPV